MEPPPLSSSGWRGRRLPAATGCRSDLSLLSAPPPARSRPASEKSSTFCRRGGRDRPSEGRKAKGHGGEPQPVRWSRWQPRSGRPGAGAGRVLTGRLPNLPATDPPGIGAAKAELALVHSRVSRKPARGCRQKRRPPWRPEQDFFFFFFWCVFEARVFVLISYFGSLC